jgi:hypothetical protein
MTKFKEIYNEETEEQILWEMARIKPSVSGLPFKIYASAEPTVEHNLPRLKVFIDNQFYPMAISTSPYWLTDNIPKIHRKQLHNLNKFVKGNVDILLKYWNDEIEEQELYNTLKHIDDLNE